MKIEVGRMYKVKDTGRAFRVERIQHHWGGLSDTVIVKVVNGTKMSGEEMIFALRDLESVDLEDISTEDFVKAEPTDSTKPAHYDTPIDTIDFMKANFSREAVEGFMRGNAIKYLQRIGKGEKLSDLKKAQAYIKMLIELEEGDKQ